MLIEAMLYISLTLFGIAIFISLYRIMTGPSLLDRVLGLDMIGVNLISAIAIISVILNTRSYLDAILVLGILAFIGTITFTKFVERGVIIDRKGDN